MATLNTSDGGQVYYESYGNGSNALVLVHGWGMSGRVWDPILPDVLKAGHRVIAIDHRGCGRSDRDFVDLSIGAIAGDIVELVAELELNSVVLNGWSLGGAVVVEAAHRLGAKCAGLVLTGGASPIYTQKPDLALGGTDEDMQGTLAALGADRVNFLHGLSKVVCAKPVGENIEDWFWRIFLEASPCTSVTLGELASLDQRDILAAMEIPVLSFVGSEDGFVAPDIGRWLGDNYGNATLVEYEGVGHAPFIEERDRYLADLLAFLVSIGGGGA